MWQKFKEKTQPIRDYRNESNNENALWIGYFSLMLGIFSYSAYQDTVRGNISLDLDLIVISSLVIYIGALIYYKDRK